MLPEKSESEVTEIAKNPEARRLRSEEEKRVVDTGSVGTAGPPKTCVEAGESAVVKLFPTGSDDFGVLGIRSSLCCYCNKEEAQLERVFVETKQLFCQMCWGKWERCGQWGPTIRVSCTPPAVGAGGLPEFGPEDAFFLPGFLCAGNDSSVFEALKSELPEGKDFSDWHGGRHLGMQFQGEGARHDGPSAPSTLKALVARMEKTFGMRADASRLNLYRSNADFKPLHADRGRDSKGVPQMTVGASFGAARELTFAHWRSGVSMSFLQSNGDVFAFTPELNDVFLHGVPKPGKNEAMGQRLSLILWGPRVSSPDESAS